MFQWLREVLVEELDALPPDDVEMLARPEAAEEEDEDTEPPTVRIDGADKLPPMWNTLPIWALPEMLPSCVKLACALVLAANGSGAAAVRDRSVGGATLRSVLVIGEDQLVIGPTGKVRKFLMRPRHAADSLAATAVPAAAVAAPVALESGAL